MSKEKAILNYLENAKKYVNSQLKAYEKLVEKCPTHPYYVDVLSRLIELKKILDKIENPSIEELEEAIKIARNFQVVPQLLRNIIALMNDKRIY